MALLDHTVAVKPAQHHHVRASSQASMCRMSPVRRQQRDDDTASIYTAYSSRDDGNACISIYSRATTPDRDHEFSESDFKSITSTNFETLVIQFINYLVILF